jgi:hypothetical protein
MQGGRRGGKTKTLMEVRAEWARTHAHEVGEMLTRLKNINIDATQLDEFVELSVYGGLLQAEYEKHSLAVPEWLTDARRTVATELRRKAADVKELRRKEIVQQLDALQGKEERRKKLEEELGKLNADQPVTV